ncbi:unnamed protein product [Adineta ricciae]|uniref:Uncharacterized protein n=1 Tax=Adineta ricciae TaxID=249248 RepID=A0A815STD4_ADIRI|nr:unnamed protein product [Adineta ricciae]
MQIIFNVCTECLAELSKSITNDEKTIEDHRNIERIISKLKQLQNSLGNLWARMITCFGRDSVDVGLYHVEADEYFHPTLFYPNVPYLVKFYQWSVYDVSRKIVCCYLLETTTLPNRPPNYFLALLIIRS